MPLSTRFSEFQFLILPQIDWKQDKNEHTLAVCVFIKTLPELNETELNSAKTRSWNHRHFSLLLTPNYRLSKLTTFKVIRTILRPTKREQWPPDWRKQLKILFLFHEFNIDWIHFPRITQVQMSHMVTLYKLKTTRQVLGTQVTQPGHATLYFSICFYFQICWIDFTLRLISFYPTT